MGIEKTERPIRKRAVLALAATLALLAAVPAAAAPSKAKAGEAGGAASLVKVWEGVWGWLTAVWVEQGNAIDPDGATSAAGEQGNAIDPDGAKRESETGLGSAGLR